MKKFILGFLAACLLWIILLSNIDAPTYRVYDCGMAEWHPDIPNEVKQECRKRRSIQYKGKNEITT